MRRNRFRSRFGGRPAVTATAGIQTGRGSRCQTCLLKIDAGQPYKRLQLQKRYRTACATCGVTPKRAKRYHEACFPVDINAAMNYNPTVSQPHAAPTVQAAAPPKPQTAADAQLAALFAIETALKRRLAENPTLTSSAELEATFKTYQGCKSRALRPGTDHEGVVAMKMALKKALDLVF